MLGGVVVEPVHIELVPCGDTPRVTLEDGGTEQQENMTEQAERPQKLKESAKVWISVAHSGQRTDRNTGSA